MFEIASWLQAHRSVTSRSVLLLEFETNEYAKQSRKLLPPPAFYELCKTRVNEGEYKHLIHYFKGTDICFSSWMT